MKTGRRNKYNATKTVYNGIKYDSKKEAAYAKELDLLLNYGEVLEIERQVPFVITINEKKICTYKLDFKVTYADRIEYVDVKGFKTSIYRLKKKMVEAYYGIEITEV